MRIGLSFLSLFFISLNSNAQKSIELKDVDNHVGDSVMVYGVVQQASFQSNASGAPTFLQLASVSGRQARAVIWGDDRKNFRLIPEKELPNREVRIIGRVELVNGKACIVIRSEQQLGVLLSEGSNNQ